MQVNNSFDGKNVSSYQNTGEHSLEKMGNEEKLQFIRSLNPQQKAQLSPQQLAFFYNNFPKDQIKINTRHFVRTLEILPPLPELNPNIETKELLTLFRKLVAQHRELVEEVADKEQEFCLARKNSNLKDGQELSSKNIDRFEEGISGLIQTVNKFNKKQNEKLAIDDVVIDSDEEETDSDDNWRDAIALKALISSIVQLIQQSDLKPIEQIENLRDMAVGGLHCERGQFTQTYKIYMKMLKLDTPENIVLKSLHDIRDSVVDYISSRAKDSSETIEQKSELLEKFGKEIGLPAQQVLYGDHQSIDYSKAREMSYITQITENFKKSGMEEADIEMLMKLIKETADQRELFMHQFYELYNPETIMQSLIQRSKEYDLYRWFLDHPREEFQDKPNDQQEYVLTHVVDNELFVKKEYMMHMLEQIGVLNF